MKLPKMKIKIVYKLFAFFTVVLFIFMLIINGFFFFFLNKQTIELQKNDLKEKVSTVASSLAIFLKNDDDDDADNTPANNMPADNFQNRPSPLLDQARGHRPGRHMERYKNTPSGTETAYYRALTYYIKFLNRTNMGDTWVIGTDRQFLIGDDLHHQPIKYDELPVDGTRMISEALAGDTVVVFNEFSNILGKEVATVAAPIKNPDGEPVGAVIMHVPLSDINNSLHYVLKLLLISSLIAMAISLPASLVLSYYATNPLRKMKNMALAVAEGRYDIETDIRQSDEIGELAETLDQMAVKIDQAAKESGRVEQARRNFITKVSHELRTPVAVLRASLEALNSGMIKDNIRQKEYHQEMLNETIYLERLVNDMLELSKLQNPDFKIEKSTFILNDLIRDASRGMRSYAAAKQIRIETDIDMPPAELMGDYGRLRQMLIIVLDNAVKFSKPGGTISLHICNKGQLGYLKISDNGCGIAPEKLTQIFERFHKIDTKNNKQGTGLGLSIAKQIAVRHNIEIEVDSVIDKGTTFTFIFKNLSMRD